MVSQENLSLNLTEYINPTENTTCRLCLKKYDLNEFEDIFKSFGNTTIAQYVAGFVKIPIAREDCFSKVVCRRCLKNLKEIDDFKQFVYKCNECLQHLYGVYSRITTKQTILDDLPKSTSPKTEISRLQSTSEDTKIEIVDHSLNESFVKIEPHLESGDGHSRNNNNNNKITVVEQKKVVCKSKKITFSCSKCGEIFADIRSRDRHLKTHTPRERYKCDLCEKTFLTKSIFIKHKRAHEEGESAEFKCKECGKQFANIYSLENHLETHTEAPKYQCDICGKRLRHPITFRSHKESHLLKMTEQKCEICNRIIRSRFPQAFKHHMKKHSLSRQKLCPKCGKVFTSPQGYDIHLKNHLGELRFKCDLCPKRYASKQSLKDHMDTLHSTAKPFSCEICGKAFAIKSGWYIHGKVHAKQNPFTCTVCDKKFGYPSHLKGHLKAVHGIVEEAKADQ